MKHRPGGGDKKVFNDVEYLRQMSDTTGAQLMAKSATGSRDSSRRESAVQVPILVNFTTQPIHKSIRPNIR